MNTVNTFAYYNVLMTVTVVTVKQYNNFGANRVNYEIKNKN